MATFADPRPDEIRSRTRLLGRAAALLALGSALVHLALVDATDLGSLAMVGMALACLPCAWHLWRAPTAGVWSLTATVDATMLTLHAQMLGAGHGSMAHGTTPLAGLLGLALVLGQLALAGLAALRR
jgi:hypothetical protein